MPGPARSLTPQETPLGGFLAGRNRTGQGLVDAAFGPLGAQDRGNQAAGMSLGLAAELAGQENANRDQTLGFLKDQFGRANAASQAAPGDLGLRMGRATDAASGQALDQWKGLRDMLGNAGVTGGGLAAGMGAQIELGRLNQIQGSKRDLAIFETERRAKAASDQFLRSLGVADVMNQGPSMILSDTLSSISDRQDNLALGMSQIRLGREQIKASREASRNQLFGGLIQGGLGLATGMLS